METNKEPLYYTYPGIIERAQSRVERENAATDTSSKFVPPNITPLDSFWNILWNVIPNPDQNLLKHGVKVYDEVMLDPIIRGAHLTLKTAAQALQWEIVANGNDDQTVEFHQKALTDLYRKNMIEYFLEAILYGNSYIEPIWQNVEGNIVPVDCINHKRTSFYYSKPKNSNSFELRYYSFANPLYGELVPPYKILCPTFEPKADNPYGIGLLQSCYKAYFIKQNAWKFWSVFVENNGTPKLGAELTTALVERLQRDWGMDSEQILLKVNEDMARLRKSGSFAYFEGMKVNPLMAGNRDGGFTHKDLMDYSDKVLIILLTGHEGSSSSTPGRLGGEMTAIAIVDTRLMGYAKFIEMFTNTMLKWIHELNFGSGPAPECRFSKRNDFQFYTNQTVIDKALFDMGFDFTLEYIENTYNINKTYITKRQLMPSFPTAPAGASTQSNIISEISNIENANEEDIMKSIDDVQPALSMNDKMKIVTQMKLLSKNILRKLRGKTSE